MRDFLTITMEFVVALFDTIIIFTFYGRFLDFKNNKQVQKKIIYGITFVLLFLLSAVHFGDDILTITSICINFLISFTLYKNKYLIKSVITILLAIIGVLAEIITGLILSSLYNTDVRTYISSASGQIEGELFSKLLLFSLVKIICITVPKRKLIISRSYGILLLFVPVFSLVIMHQIGKNALSSLPGDFSLNILSTISILFINIIIFTLFDGLAHQEEKKIIYALAEQQVVLQASHYSELNESRKTLKGMVHDFKNHLIGIQKLAKDNKCELIINYVGALNNQFRETTEVVDSGNPVLDAIIYSKREDAIAKDIEMNISTHIPQDINIQPMDICIIMGNALDNAIEACNRINEYHQGKRIDIDLCVLNSYFIISIKNSSNECKIENGTFKTEKAEKNSHGLGLYNISKTVSKYNGNMMTEYKDGVFDLKIVLQI